MTDKKNVASATGGADTARNIYARMAAITAELPWVEKSLEVDTGGGKYKAVGSSDILAAVKPVEHKHGVYSWPLSTKILSSEMVTKTFNSGKSRTEMNMRVEVVYRFVNVDAPEEHVDVTAYGDGIDSQDKAPGKASTYAIKYALISAYKIAAGTDPDQHGSESGHVSGGNGDGNGPKRESDQIDKKMAVAVEAELQMIGIDVVEVCRYYRVASLETLSYDDYGDLRKMIEKKQRLLRKEQEKQPVQSVSTESLFEMAATPDMSEDEELFRLIEEGARNV
jgi:hypothetical protein